MMDDFDAPAGPRYLVFPSIEEAQKRSAEIAVARGCDPTQGTQYWYNVTTKGAEAALVIGDGGGEFDEKERAALQTEDQMRAAGWLKPPEI